uniref:TRAF-type zinc finger domain-containing protein 1 n=1 Tax=Oncorhynchus kisutch TaxID=8019 RepID=A0A8C7E0K2_ONCKI
MPGVNLDFLSASEAPQPLVGNPDSLCAESGLEEVIGDLLAQDQAEEEESEGGECGLELTLRCAVGEIHSDLQAFGKRVDARLEEAAARVAPLSTALAALQEENLRLRIQQERLARQVEALCQALGLPEPPPYTAFVPEPTPSTPNDLQLPSSTPLSPKTPDGRDCEPEATLVPHCPTFATRRSSSTSSLIGLGGISHSNSMMETEPVMASEPMFAVEPSVQVACCQAPATVPNGSSAARAKVEERSGKLTAEQLAAIDDEELLDKMLDESKDFEERKMIRQAMRDLRKRKREAVLGCTQEEIDQREKEREVRLVELRQQREERAQKGRTGGGGAEEVVMRKVEKSADGSTLSQVTKTNHFAQSGDGSRTAHSTIMEASYVKKTDMGTVQSKSYSYSSTSSSSSSARKVGSVFDREDDTASRAAERRQAEKRKELMRAQSLPKTSAAQSRKAMIEKLEKESGGPGNKAVAKVNMVQRSASCVVPNANSIKQMLLDWCRAKTRSYENVDIQNFSSSWSDGMAFCALVHNFFPEAFDYSSLTAANRRHNFEVAFSTAEKLADCPELLDVEDMVRMREPDWKCVYTYLQEFYRGLVTKGLVKTKNSS